MIPERGEIWLAILDQGRGSEQVGNRPVLIYQNPLISRFTSTVLTIPFTTNLHRAQLPTCFLVRGGEGGLASDSVALCHQLRVLDKTRLRRRLGTIGEQSLKAIDGRVLFTLGIV